MSWLGDLRDAVPRRRLNFMEARLVAERQASLLRKRLGVEEPAVDTRLLTSLPFVVVGTVRLPLGPAASTRWKNGHWTIVINGSEPPTRQRFSLAHELKHCLDDPFVELLYGHPKTVRRQTTEHVCDYFAACLLMDKVWVKRVFFSGVQKVEDLAELFDVSPVAMHIRLLQLGLVEAYGRHGDAPTIYLRTGPVWRANSGLPVRAQAS